MHNASAQPPTRKEPERTRQTSTRVGWNGEFGGWTRDGWAGNHTPVFALSFHVVQYCLSLLLSMAIFIDTIAFHKVYRHYPHPFWYQGSYL